MGNIVQIEPMRNRKINEQDKVVIQYVHDLVTGGTEEELRLARVEASRNHSEVEDEHI